MQVFVVIVKLTYGMLFVLAIEVSEANAEQNVREWATQEEQDDVCEGQEVVWVRAHALQGLLDLESPRITLVDSYIE